MRTAASSDLFALGAIIEDIEQFEGITVHGTTGWACAIAPRLRLLADCLHAHWRSEDVGLFATLAERFPTRASDIERLRRERAALLAEIVELEQACRRREVSVCHARRVRKLLGEIRRYQDDESALLRELQA